jgi:hypothetical protein
MVPPPAIFSDRDGKTSPVPSFSTIMRSHIFILIFILVLLLVLVQVWIA